MHTCVCISPAAPHLSQELARDGVDVYIYIYIYIYTYLFICLIIQLFTCTYPHIHMHIHNIYIYIVIYIYMYYVYIYICIYIYIYIYHIGRTASASQALARDGVDVDGWSPHVNLVYFAMLYCTVLLLYYYTIFVFILYYIILYDTKVPEGTKHRVLCVDTLDVCRGSVNRRARGCRTVRHAHKRDLSMCP